jgi:DNA-binding NarL/FixJ family response regulator
VVDDNEIVRMGVRGLLCSQPQWEICGEAENGADAISKVAELSPDVVILDMIMPVISGIEAASRIRRISPSTKIVFFSIHDTPTTARMAGADAFVSKSSAAQELVRAINNVLQSLGNPSGPLPAAADVLTN